MKFKTYEIPNNIENAVYILFDDDEVIYVGQTNKGLKRILQHTNKVFNKYAFIETDNLEYYEDYYIMKYQPKYNRSYNHYRISLESAYSKLSSKIRKEMNVFEFAKYIESKKVKISKFKNKSTITKDDYKYIIQQIEKDLVTK